jgi:hypothetical protein
MRLSSQLNLYPKKVYKWHWDRKKRLDCEDADSVDIDISKSNGILSSASAVA